MSWLVDTNVQSELRKGARANEGIRGDRVLVIDAEVAGLWGRLNVPDPVPTVDGLLAATALVHDLVLVTRNTRDVQRTGVRVLDPRLPDPADAFRLWSPQHGGQDMASLDEMKAAYEEAARSGDFQQMGDSLQKFASEDFVDEWPQSGERLNMAALQKMGESYSGATGTRPSFKYKRMLTGGDLLVVEGTIDYGDGVPVRYVAIGEVRDGKVARMTEYFANPFEAPAWRAPFVERYEP